MPPEAGGGLSDPPPNCSFNQNRRITSILPEPGEATRNGGVTFFERLPRYPGFVEDLTRI
jgi:hypothetical protein